MGNSMQVIGNNISNMNTVGFKKGRTTFADTLSQTIATQSGTAEVGRGMSTASVDRNFEQGSFESTGNTTDLSIGGDGFFVLRQDGTQANYYTRAGSFNFNDNGMLVNPEGYIVQGWELDDETGDDIGSIKDIVLGAFTSPPEQSSRISVINNLDSDSTSNTVVLANIWDSGSEDLIESTGYEYQTAIQVYDSLGTTHDLTIYYDKKSDSEWEYIIACNPEEDKRNLVQDTDSKGLLARGIITFSQGSGDVLDFTMEKYTGRIGSQQASGVNNKEDVHYDIMNYDKLNEDGYGFELEFDGIQWEFADTNGDGVFVKSDDLPENYSNARIIFSDSQNIEIALSPANTSDREVDLKIKLDNPAIAANTIGFDVNATEDIHLQGMTGITYVGETGSDNTIIDINDPNVMSRDAEDISAIWYPSTDADPEEGEWHWSNPLAAASAGTVVIQGTTGLVTDVSTTSGLSTTAVTIVNPMDLGMIASDVKVMYDGTDWVWNNPLKVEDITNEVFDFSPLNPATLEVVDPPGPGTEGAIEFTGIVLEWLASSDTWTSSASIAAADVIINATASSDTTVVFAVSTIGATAGSETTFQYTFGSSMTSAAGQNLSFNIVPSPPVVYPNAVITTNVTGGGGTTDFGINFDGDTEIDLIFDVNTAGGTAVGLGDFYLFSVDPDVPPTEYANATLKGDEEEAVIDLDGSGTDEDNDDIVFSFNNPLRFGLAADPYDDLSYITFDITGSTAWESIEKSDIVNSGYFSFTTDFLGGEEGSTEMDVEFDIGSPYDGQNFINNALSTTQYARSSSTVFQDADGYAAGDLESVNVASDGIITGVYSNGQLIPLFRVGLANFLNDNGLEGRGGNLFAETRDSGAAITNKPGQNGLGTITSNSLEMSNVDISEEFVRMITIQRGYESNSKIVTTVDAMMNTVIQMKR